VTQTRPEVACSHSTRGKGRKRKMIDNVPLSARMVMFPSEEAVARIGTLNSCGAQAMELTEDRRSFRKKKKAKEKRMNMNKNMKRG